MVTTLVRCAAVFALVTAGTAVVADPAGAAVKHYSNCTELHKKYKHGVGRKGAKDKVRGHTRPVTTFTVNTAVYNANKKKLDRDKDGVACEKL
jgi:Excalibur calcium-binding domain